jgi:hypothetical protein
MSTISKNSLETIKTSLIQTLGLILYIGLISLIFRYGDTWTTPLDAFWGPILFLSLFAVSVLICGLLVFGYPIKLFFVKKKPKQAIKVVLLTALWLTLFFLGLLTYFLIR